MSEKKYVSDSKLAHYHNKLKNKIANDNATTLSSAKSYADSTIDSKVGSAIGSAIGSAKKYTDDEVAGLAAETSEALEALTTAVNNKSSKTHNHAITDVTNLRNELDSKANKDEVGSLYVTITANDNGYISDVSFNEIIEAYLLGRPIYALIGEFTLPLYMASSEMVGFVIQAADEAITVLISSENDVQAEFVEFTADMFGADEFGAADKALQSAKTYTDTKTSALSTQISTKASQSSVDELSDGLSAHKSASNPHNITKSTIGLGSVDNTPDASKPVSTAQATAIADAKKAGTDAQSAIDAHEALTNNPHGVTAAQVGLGNVPNVTTNNQKPTFTVASSLSALTSGNSLSTQFGKIAKAISDLIAHLANKSNPHEVTAAQVGADPAGSASAVQANLNTLNDEFDDHTENADIHFTAAERTKLSGIATGANKYTHPNSGVTAGTYKSVTVNAAGHVTGGSNPTTLAGYGITDAEAKGTATSTVGTHNTSDSAHNDIRTTLSELNTKVNNFLNVTDTTKDQLSEIIALIEANADDIETITSGKVNVADIVNNLTTNVTNKPLSAAQGVALKALVDALDSDKVDKVSGKGLSTNDYTTTEKNKLSGIAAGAEVNQNAFSNIKVGTTTVAADAKTDTVEFVGSNVTITPDATNDKITFAVASGTTSTAGIVKLSTSTSSTSTSLAATPSAVKSAYDLANTAKTNAATAQTTADGASDAAAAAQSTADTATTNLANHIGNTSNPHGVTAAQVGLGNVPNVTTNNQTPTYTVASSNAELKSGETMTTAFGKIAKAVSSLIAHLSNTSNPHSVTKAQVGLGNVDNTADANKTVKAAGTATTATTLSGLTATVAELNYMDGVTSAVQTQLNAKATKDVATASANGLMSSVDKTKLDATNIAYGTCETAAATAAKVVTVSGNTNWTLAAGSSITVFFSKTNTASNPTLNVNGTGAKNIYYGASKITTSSLGYAGTENRLMTFVYDGTQYRFAGWGYDSNTTYTNVKLGHGYTTCSTAEATTAKACSLSSYTLTTGGIVAVKFTNAVPAGSTLNVNSKGAKAIYHRGAAITAGVIKAGDTATFIYSGQYHLISVDRDDDTVVTLNDLGVTATAAELNYVDGVTSNIQTQLNGKAASSHGTHVTYSTTAPAANGTASAGSAANVSRGDHVHPLQTTVSGNAGTATKLQTARTITLSGDASGSVSFDGSENKTLTVTVADDSHNHVISNVDGLQAALDGKAATSEIPTVYTAAQCTTFTSDSGTCTPLAVQNAAKKFAIPRITSTANAIARYDGTAGEVKNSTILIEDVTNTKNSSLKAQVISIPAANGTKKMVYGYCTDQTDGTSFIGGLFDADATAFPYAEGLAIGGSSGNLLWKGVKVATATDIPSVPVKSVNGKTGAVSLSYTDIVGLQDTLTEMQEQIDEASSSAGGAFDFDAYANAAGYSYSYDKSTMTETITYGGSTFATRTNTKGTNQWTVVTTCSSMGVNTTKIWTKTDSGWTAS